MRLVVSFAKCLCIVNELICEDVFIKMTRIMLL